MLRLTEFAYQFKGGEIMHKEVEAVLNVLAERFGTTVELLWAILIKQQFVEAIMGAIACLVSLSVIIVLAFALVAYYKKGKFHEFVYDNDLEPPVVIIGLIAFITTLTIFLCNIGPTIGKFINPEYYALRVILQLF